MMYRRSAVGAAVGVIVYVLPLTHGMVVVVECVELELDMVVDFVLVVGVLVFLVVLELDTVLTFLAINVVLVRASFVLALVVSP